MKALTAWQSPPAAWALADNAVHLWQVRLNPSEPAAAALSRLLTQDEQQRVTRLRFAADRRRYQVTRGALRVILGQYLGTAPTEVRFAYGLHGRPEIADAATLRFNVSHSGELALIAVTCARPLGVDVEFIRPVEQADDLVRTSGSSEENAAYQALPVAQRQLAFFNLWTRKEAYLKATGQGLSDTLEQIDVTLAPDQPAQFRYLPGDPAEAGRWQLWAGEPQPGYVAAVAVRDRACELSGWQWDECCLVEWRIEG